MNGWRTGVNTRVVLRALLAMGCAVTFVGAGETQSPPGGTAIVYPVDDAMMVYVPAGEFLMGLEEKEADTIAQHLGYKDGNALWAWETYPKRTVYLPGFFIDQYEVTVKRWQSFVRATGHKTRSGETTRHFDKPEEALLPAGEIAWDEARQYCQWAGKLLPMEAQWEKAARGTDGRFYPWGNDRPTVEHGHFGENGKQPPLYVEVGQYPKGASPYGVFDMLGNQYEWTADWMEPYPGNAMAAKMRAYSGHQMVVLRGGSWYHGWIGFYAAKRFGFKPTETYYHVGFRTVWVPPDGYFQTKEFQQARAAAQARPAE